MQRKIKSFLAALLFSLWGILGANAQNTPSASCPNPTEIVHRTATAPSSETQEIAFTKTSARPINYNELRLKIGYPDAALQAGVQGQVLLHIWVDETGNYLKHTVTNSASPLLLQEIEKVISQLKCSPATENGKAVSGELNMPFNFKMSK